jgi:hypothetical protein
MSKLTPDSLTLTRGKLPGSAATFLFFSGVGDAFVRAPTDALSPFFSTPISHPGNKNSLNWGHSKTLNNREWYILDFFLQYGIK